MASSADTLEFSGSANVSTFFSGMLYVTEIYTRHTLITPFNSFGITVPNTLYSIAYF